MLIHRRKFLTAAGAVAAQPWLHAAEPSWDLSQATVVTVPHPAARAAKAVSMLVEEAERRSGLRWRVESGAARPAPVTIYAATRASWSALGSRAGAAGPALSADGFSIRTGSDSSGRWIAIAGADDRGLLFGIGKLLRSIDYFPQRMSVTPSAIEGASSPRYPLRGHQLGYRPKTNAYDAWDVSQWERYYRDMIAFGTNAVELIPPRSDDLDDSPHFPLPKGKMMTEMSRLADEYGLETWVWYPAMDPDYGQPGTVEAALKEWAAVFQSVPRIDAVFVPGGDPGHTEPRYMLALLERQKENLRRFHPKAQMWMSPQSFRADWLDQFFDIVGRSETQRWLDGVVFGPQSRLPLDELRRRLPARYPIRLYPDITHSVQCQYPVPEWDIAFALTEGREVINPRPEGEANILRRTIPGTLGFITYSEGCNDDVNKFVWSALGWNPDQPVISVLRDFARYFVGSREAEGVAQGLLELESNWRGPLAANARVSTTLARFQDVERSASPAALESWRLQQALYRAYFDAYVQARLFDESAALSRAAAVLAQVSGIGWNPQPMDIGDHPSAAPPNGLDPSLLLDQADSILAQPLLHPAAPALRQRVAELGEALFQSIHMQLAVQRYQGEAVNRAANLETLDHPVTDVAWLRRQIAAIRKIDGPNRQVDAIRALLARTDPGPGGFYDELGNPSNRPHLIPGPGSVEDPEFRSSALTGCDYPDALGDFAPMAWKHWAESLFDAPLRMKYTSLDPNARYRLRIVYSGDSRRVRIRLQANGKFEIHPLIPRPHPPVPQEFDVPAEATAGGQLDLAWTREPGLGGNGRGCQVAEVWLLRAD